MGPWCEDRRLVQELPGLGTIESPDSGGLDHGSVKVAEVDAHPVASSTVGLPMRQAAAGSASTMGNAFVTPNVTVQRISAGHNLHLALIVVAEDSTVPTADRTVATGQGPRLARDLDLHRSTMA
jgi:hypothetical protein